MDFDRLNRKLEGLGKASLKGFRVRNLLEIMNCPEIWHLAYANVYSNQGAMTKGVDDVTLDGMSKDRMGKIVEAIKAGKYRPKPVRRTYIPKKDGNKRPLGVPSGDDKLVQAVIKILLESVYEPVFSDRSHGFRPIKSCHTALEQILKTWAGVKWFVEFDIKGFFDNVDHDILIETLEKKIDDKRFIRLIKAFLKAGYMEDFVFHNTYSGTPQGGIISPILSNIYLHDFDLFMEKTIQDYRIGNKRPLNPEWKKIGSKIYRLRKKLRTKGNHADVVKEIKALHKLRQTLPSTIEQTETHKRLLYCRYADDFVCGVIGSHEDAVRIMRTIEQYLNKLNLELSPDKTRIDRATKSIEFLSHNIRRVKSNRSRKTSMYGTHVTRRSVDVIHLSVPRRKVVEFCNKYAYGIWHTKKPKPRGKLITSSEAEIISTYNAELRGLINYFHLCRNVKHELSTLFYLAHFSMFKTIAGKRKSKVTKVLHNLKTAKGYFLKYPYKDGWKEIEMFQVKHLTKPNKCDDQFPFTHHFYQSGSELISRMEAEICEYCGQSDTPVEVHHVRKLKDLKSQKHLEFWERVMIARNRKTMILCTECHQLLHKGKLPDKRHKPKND